jgi:hypothetical protein
MFRSFVVAASLVLLSSAVPAQAGCLNKAAEATAGSEKDAKWYVLETMVQSVSWGLWPSFLADGSTPGWRITKQRYRCNPGGAGITCRGQATFCETGSN